jgi:hypothetical protein
MSKLLNTQKNALQMLWDDCKELTKRIAELPKTGYSVNSALVVKGWTKTIFIVSDGVNRYLTFKNLTSEIKAKIKWQIVLDNSNGAFDSYNISTGTELNVIWSGHTLVLNVTNSYYNNLPVEIKLYV